VPFNTSQHSNLGYVDKEYKVLLDKLCAAEKRSIKDELEVLIYRAAVSMDITTSKK
jgi:hypothetical protein